MSITATLVRERAKKFIPGSMNHAAYEALIEKLERAEVRPKAAKAEIKVEIHLTEVQRDAIAALQKLGVTDAGKLVAAAVHKNPGATVQEIITACL